MRESLGRVAVRFALTYLRRRYRREIRIGIGISAAAVAIAVYWANREVPEG